MKILVTPDSFKGTMSSLEVSEVIRRNIVNHIENCNVILLPLADGGEGTTEALVYGNNGEMIPCEVTGPFGDKLNSSFGISNDRTTAYIEVAAAVGINLIKIEDRNPLKTTTFGVGELILNAVEMGCKKIIIGLGGSSTNDGGAGMAQALGVKFYDEDNKEISFLSGDTIGKIKRIDYAGINSKLEDIEIVVASDVKNPLLGQSGATYIYAEQKGATELMKSTLESNMKNYVEAVVKSLGKQTHELHGAGAAGGLGYAMLTYLDASMKSGVDLILDNINFEHHLEECDLVITGEGCLDYQSLFGKAVYGVTKRAQSRNINTITVSGINKCTDTELQELGIIKAYSVVPENGSINESLEEPLKHLDILMKQVVTDIKEQIICY